MSREPITVPSTMRLMEVVEIMASKQIGSTVVNRAGAPVGVVTEREIISDLVMYGKISADATAGGAMTPVFVRVNPGMSIEDAARATLSMKGRLLVFEGEDLVGILTVTDLVRALSKSRRNPSFKGTASMHIHSVPADGTVASALRVMHKKRIGSLLITEKDVPTAIFTERDLLTRVLNRGEPLTRRVGDFASKPLITLPLNSGARDAAAVMVEKKIKRLPLKSEGKIVGIVTARDVVESFITS